MPRPTNPDNGHIQLRVTVEEKREWQECADEDRQALTVWIRRKLNEIARRRRST